MKYTTTLIAALAAASGLPAVGAHMIINKPTPYGKSSLNNSPLANDGSDYPCKQRPGVYDAQGANNVMPLGSTQELSFTGSAVHGGGSCQISITYDKQPTKNSVFKVIHSIIGGCPAKGVQGNLPANPNGSGASTYNFQIPADLPTGEATIAWTWFNKVGNREMYMNCAPVTITGGSARRARSVPVLRRDQSAYDSLPKMFKANIGNGCTTADSQDVAFPNPGSSVEKAGSGAPVPPVGSCGSGAGAGTGSGPAGDRSGSGSEAAPGNGSGQSGQYSAAPSASPSSSPTSNPGGNFIPNAASSSAAPVAPTPTSAPTPSSQPNTPSAPPSGYAGSGAGTGTGTSSGTSSGALSGPCANEGAFICLPGGKSFQQCGSGHWSVPMQMAAGTSCATGDGASLSVKAYAPQKRHVRFSHGHILRGLGVF
ncbi:MAG: hypothetical protein M1816_002573 [Peltula sp. TS41687]|nr:MAG: hypothetical protein M1816_002573 [Peltula sp. TS41687]